MRKRLLLPALCLAILTVFTDSSCHKDLPYTQLGNWVEAAAIGNYPRGFPACFVIGQTAYVGLGENENIGGLGRLKDFWSFTVDSGWTQCPDFPGAPRSRTAAFSLGNYGYVGTGSDGIAAYNDFYQYDPGARQWRRKADYAGGPRYEAVGFGLQGKGYIGTGYHIYWMNDFYQYDPAQDSWVKTIGTSGDFSKRRGAAAFVYNNKAYIVTGSTSGKMARDFWSFDPSLKVPWTRLNNITNTNHTFDNSYTDIERQYAVIFVNGDKAYLTTGQGSGSGFLTSTWAYDFAQDVWTRRTPFPRSQRYGSVAFTVSGQSFLGAGSTGNSTLDDFSRFIPDQPYNPND